MDDHKDNTSIPSWLNNEFLTRSLESTEGTPKVLSSKIHCLNTPGKVHSNDLYRAVVQVSQQGKPVTKSLMVKTRNKEEIKVTSKEKSLTNEILVYNEALEPMNKFLEKCNSSFSPKHYFSQDGVLVLQDLEAEGFEHPTPSFGLDMSHCIAVIRKLAQYHASSVVLRAKNLQITRSFNESSYSVDSRTELEKILPSVIRHLAEKVERSPSFKKGLAEKLHNLANSAVDEICDCAKTKENEYLVLVHENLWFENLMFLYNDDTGDVKDVRFLDFQTSHWGSPAIDIHRFVHACAAPEVMEWIQVLVEEYYCVLGETLKTLGYPQLHVEISHLYTQLQKKIAFGLILGLVSRAVTLSDPDYASDQGIVWNSNRIHFSEKFMLLLKKILIVYQQKGWL